MSQFESRVLLKTVLGAWAVLHHNITTHEHTQLNRGCFFVFFLMRSLLPVYLYSELILSSLQLVLCRVAALNVSLYIIIVQIISSLVLWGHWAHSESV